jgi:IstB-like ATP binding protein
MLERLLAIEVTATEARRRVSLERFASLPAPWRLSDFDFDAQPSVDRSLVNELGTLRFLEDATNVLFIGPPGVGKTMLAVALARAALKPVTGPTTRQLHTDPCAGWGSKARIGAVTWEIPVLAQLGLLHVDRAMRAQIVAALSSGERPTTIDRARLERQMRELALDHAAARLGDAAYLDRMAELRAQLESLQSAAAGGTPAGRAVEWLEALAETWQRADVPEATSDVLHAVYERIVVAGPEFVGVRLTPAAYSHGLALALPEAVRARPTGVGRALTAYRIRIEGRDEWIAATRARSA